MDWKTMLAYVTGSVDEELLRRNEYLVAENRILQAQIPGRLKLTDDERRTLANTSRRFLAARKPSKTLRSEEHTSELQSPCNLVCRLLLEKKKKKEKLI